MRRGSTGLVDPATPASEAFRTLRLAVQLRSDAESGNIIVVTSAEPGAGKSTVAANFALVSSMLPGRVLLIDADLRRSSQHQIFGLPRSPGLVDLLATNSGLEQLVHPIPGAGQLDVLTAGRPIPRSSDLAASPNMADALRQASEAYDLVVVDSSPVLSVADTEGLASHARVSVIVVTRPQTRARQLVKTMRRLELIEARVAGVVVNTRRRTPAYGY